ncbi:hypothetical protein C8F04DRAFT_1101285 [Mycena alexandri]|uniref:F-box domain-containing protein n=1 Tax=Mycena alexandri TaxID=1745969 RepID=A0AAD6SVM3_9AGAR|nr:hypothetical protein C8F04DRAFT_1101285 [Mycena alexandri]
MKSSPWSRIPPEIANEIAGHNSKDVPALRAMSLVSKQMRFLAIEHLFSVIHFACAEDFPRWLELLRTTPSLTTFVKRVRFSKPGATWLRRHRGPKTSQLDDNTLPHLIPPLLHASAVEWVRLDSISLQTAAAYIKLLPNVQKLHLEYIFFGSLISLANFLGNFGNLKALSVVKMYIEPGYGLRNDLDDDDLSGQPGSLNLSQVDELAITSCAPYPSDDLEDFQDPILYLLTHSPPAGLRSLDLGGFGYKNGQADACTLLAMEKLLCIGAPSFLSLTIEPTFLEELSNTQFVDMAGRLTVFSALRTLTIWLDCDRQAEQLLNTLKAAPNLTMIIFRIRLHQESDKGNHDHLDSVLNTVLPWKSSLSLKSTLTQKFPLIQQIGFHFSVPHSSDVHFRREYRRKMEKRLWEHLERTGDASTDYLPVKWLDVEDNNTPVVYSQVNGEASWLVPHARRFWEPDTEGSDCASEKSDSGSDSDSEHP